LEGVQVVNDEPRRPAAAGQGGEQLRVRVRGRDLALLDDALHRADRIESEHHRERLDERLQQHDHHLELRQRHVVVVKGSEEQDVLARKKILKTSTTSLRVLDSWIIPARSVHRAVTKPERIYTTRGKERRSE
jgi:hypothetical protein